MAKTSTPHIPTLSFDSSPDNPKRKLINVENMPVKQCPQLKIIRIDMSIYFGSISHIQKKIAKIVDNEHIYHILIKASGINFIDLAGAEALVTENNRLKEKNGGLYFYGLKPSVYEFAAKSCFISKIGNGRFFDNKTQVFRGIYHRLDKSICSGCQMKIFRECQ